MIKTYSFAGIPVSVEYFYSYTENLLQGYETSEEPIIHISITKEDIEFERNKLPQQFFDGYLESTSLLRKFSTAAAEYGVLMFHSSAIEYNGKAYLYAAVSGTGKSTHTDLCCKTFKDKVTYINDDKPFLKYADGKWSVWGNPWNGKHGRGNNIVTPLGAICILKRGEENSITKVSGEYAFPYILVQTYRPNDPKTMQYVLDKLAVLSKENFYELYCNISEEAARLSLGTMSGEIK